MADGYTQDTRVGKLTTPFGDDVLLLSRFWSEEELSQVHPFHIEALSTDGDIDFDHALGQNCTLKLIASDGLERDFCGVLVEAEFKGMRDELFVYQPGAAPVALAAEARVEHKDIRESDRARHHQESFPDARIFRFSRRVDRVLSDAEILRPI